MKAKAKNYKGIEFINVSELPTSQKLLLQHSQEPERIKILMDGKIQGNCIQYSKYEKWFTSVYKRSVATADTKPVKEKDLQVSFSPS